jgi:hypothetical protein
MKTLLERLEAHAAHCDILHHMNCGTPSPGAVLTRAAAARISQLEDRAAELQTLVEPLRELVVNAERAAGIAEANGNDGARTAWATVAVTARGVVVALAQRATDKDELLALLDEQTTAAR